MDDVLKSWANPKGPTYGEKRHECFAMGSFPCSPQGSPAAARPIFKGFITPLPNPTVPSRRALIGRERSLRWETGSRLWRSRQNRPRRCNVIWLERIVILVLLGASYIQWKPNRAGFMPSRFLTVKDLAALLNLSESWIYDRTSGKGPEVIPHIKFGRQVRFNIESDEFRAWMNAHGVGVEVAEPRSLTA